MHFTIRQLEVFVQAAADENFRVTADRLGISQPTISKHIKSLERTAGGSLFDRQRGSSARLSPLGRKMVDQAWLLLGEARKVSLGGAAASGAAPVRMIAGPLIVDQLIRPHLTEYYALPGMPDLEVTPIPLGEEAYSTLRSGRADVAYFIGDKPDIPGLSVRLLRRIDVGVFACPGIAATYADDIDRIDDAPWILAPLGSPLNEWLKRILGEVGIRPVQIVARPQFTEVSRDLALRGLGLAVLLDTEARPYVKRGELVRLPVQLSYGYRFMLTRAGSVSPAIERTIEYWCKKLA